jgi:hypothetical protein
MLTDKATHVVRLTPTDGVYTLRVEHAEVSGQVEGAARSTGDVFPFAINAAYFLDSLAASHRRSWPCMIPRSSAAPWRTARHPAGSWMRRA